MSTKSKSKNKSDDGSDINALTNSKSEGDELINKLFNLLNELISKDVIYFWTAKYSNELHETLKIIENCTSCKKDNVERKVFHEFHVLINKLESKQYARLNNKELIKIDNELNRKVLCEGCKEKKIKDLITKCENEEMARLLYESKLNSDSILNIAGYIQWIPFNEFGNIEYLAKGGFGEVQKAKWIGRYYDEFGNKSNEETKVVLKRLYNSRDKILDILKEVNKKKV
jgi:hypothetical protein